jgi:hypothetical protein
MSLEPRLPEKSDAPSSLPTGEVSPNLENLKLSAPLNSLEIILQAQRETLSPADYIQYLQAAEQRLRAYLVEATEQNNLTLETIHGNVSSALSSASHVAGAAEVCILNPSKYTRFALELPRDKEFSLQELRYLWTESGRSRPHALEGGIRRLKRKGVLVEIKPRIWKLADKHFQFKTQLRKPSGEELRNQITKTSTLETQKKYINLALTLPAGKEFSVEGLMSLWRVEVAESLRAIQRGIRLLQTRGILIETKPQMWRLADPEALSTLLAADYPKRSIDAHNAQGAKLSTLVEHWTQRRKFREQLELWVRDHPQQAHEEGLAADQTPVRQRGEDNEYFLRRTYLVAFSGRYGASKPGGLPYPQHLPSLLGQTPYRYFQTLARSIMNDRIAKSASAFKAEVPLEEISRRMLANSISPRISVADLRQYVVQLILDSRKSAVAIWSDVTGAPQRETPSHVSRVFSDIILEHGRERAKAACAVLYEDWAVPWQPSANTMRYIQARLEDQMSIKEVRQRYDWKSGMYAVISYESKVLLPALANLSPRMLR